MASDGGPLGVRFVAAAALLAVLAGCAPDKQSTASKDASHALGLTAVGYGELPGWTADRADAALATFLGGCAAMADDPGANLGGTGSAVVEPAAWRTTCDAAQKIPAGDPAAARAYFERSFQPYAVADTASETSGLFTGYYEPELQGSRTPGPGYPTPLLRRPNDLVTVDLSPFDDDLRGRHITGHIQGGTVVPYPDRASIESGALAAKRLDLLWVSDPVDAYILQVQGSGRVRLPDGRIVRVSYDGQNGRRSILIGKVLAEQGAIPLDKVTMPAIRAWLAAHPDQAASVLDRDPSYVFFRELDGVPADRGPPGALGASLVPGRSIAVDKRFLPLGAPVFLATIDPLDNSPFRRLMVAEDLGGAIRGPVRADVFWGWDADAATRAGLMRAPGRAWVLLPRAPTIAAAAR